MIAPEPAPPFHVPPIVTYAVPFFVATIIIEMIWIRVSKKGRYQVADSFSSLSMGFGNQIVGMVFGAAFTLAAYYWVYEHRLFTLTWTAPVMVACFFGEDCAYYWFHRIAHERRFFWASHVVHHSSQHYNLTTALRQTWTGAAGFNFIFWLPLLYIGFPPTMVLMFTAISLVYQYWVHTELIGRLGPLEWVMNTPSHHRVHHAVNAKYHRRQLRRRADHLGQDFRHVRAGGRQGEAAIRHRFSARNLQPVPGGVPRMGRHVPRPARGAEFARSVGICFRPAGLEPGWFAQDQRLDQGRLGARAGRRRCGRVVYVPEHFSTSEGDALIARLARRFAGVLISVDGEGQLLATHMPMLWDGRAAHRHRPHRPRQSALAGGPRAGADRFGRAAGLCLAEFLSVEGRAWKSRADVEL